MPMLVKGKMSITQQEVMMLITYSSLIRNICARICTFNEQKNHQKIRCVQADAQRNKRSYSASSV